MSAPLFNWLTGRSAGVLLHPTALPGPTGIGTFGSYAHKFVDFLAQAGMHYWQLLPLGPTSYGDSPYQSFSVFAGNPYLIDLHALIPLGLLTEEDLQPLQSLGPTKVDFGAQYYLRYKILTKAYEKFAPQRTTFKEYGSYDKFVETHESWLKPYALFMALKDHHNGAAWHKWPVELQSYAKAQLSPLAKQLQSAVDAQIFWQHLFWGQWQRLKDYAASRGIKIIGDLPIFVADDSADVWANPELFQLDANHRLTHVAGCPPDYFSETGQHWGNPLYDWEMHHKTHYKWWLKRLGHAFELYDVARVDHFRGFHDYWRIPASAPDARTGEWAKGPGVEFFKTVAARYPNAQLIAEDLGELNQGVHHLLDEIGSPGMSIFQFAFGGDSHNPYLPHNIKTNQIYYTGTHDNDTTAGWFAHAPEHVRTHVLNYFSSSSSGFTLDLALRAVLESVANLAIIPVQDLLGLNSSARFNTPGTPSGNWDWRLTEDMFAQLNSKYIHELLSLYGRV